MTDNLDRILRDDARRPLADDGFAARVMGALPARARGPRMWMRPALIFGSAAVGSLLAALFAPPGINLFQGFADLMQLKALTPAAITGVAMAIALLASGIVLAFDD
jgi:hypothetical protein